MLSGFAVGRIYGIPYLAIFALALILLIEIGIRATVWGRRFVAVGVNARAARAASLRVISYKVATYAVAGAFYALSGILLAGYLRVPSLLVGNSYLLPTITVVVLGGTSLLGGAGSVAATAIGAIFLVQLQQVVIGMGAPTSAQFVIQAAIILLGHVAARRAVASARRCDPRRASGRARGAKEAAETSTGIDPFAGRAGAGSVNGLVQTEPDRLTNEEEHMHRSWNTAAPLALAVAVTFGARPAAGRRRG